MKRPRRTRTRSQTQQNTQTKPNPMLYAKWVLNMLILVQIWQLPLVPSGGHHQPAVEHFVQAGTICQAEDGQRDQGGAGGQDGRTVAPVAEGIRKVSGGPSAATSADRKTEENRANRTPTQRTTGTTEPCEETGERKGRDQTPFEGSKIIRVKGSSTIGGSKITIA